MAECSISSLRFESRLNSEHLEAHLPGCMTELVDGILRDGRGRRARPLYHAGRLRGKFETQIQRREFVLQPCSAKNLMRRNSHEVGLRYDRQHGHETVAVDRASRHFSASLVKRALKGRSCRIVPAWKYPLEGVQ